MKRDPTGAQVRPLNSQVYHLVVGNAGSLNSHVGFLDSCHLFVGNINRIFNWLEDVIQNKRLAYKIARKISN